MIPLPRQKRWDEAIRDFLKDLGLTQALFGFEADMLVMNDTWEKRRAPEAIHDLVEALLKLSQHPNQSVLRIPNERTFDEQKLEYAHSPGDSAPRVQTSVNKSISAYIAQIRARNDKSNRAEFLHSRSRRRGVEAASIGDQMGEGSSYSATSEEADAPSCARTDATSLDRDVHMQYDIANNGDGILRQTISKRETELHQIKEDPSTNYDTLVADRSPGLVDRVRNIETHLAIRYVPSTPSNLISRLKFLEDHLIKLEREYPPWAALHFHQPNRGWPPPPYQTPIIVPSHMTSTHDIVPADAATELSTNAESPAARSAKTKKSSLHRAVMEKLEVRRAMDDLAGVGCKRSE